MTLIRPEQSRDVVGIRAVNEAAFDTSTEADIVDMLRRNCEQFISFVAVEQEVVGHILFTPVTIDSQSEQTVGMGLAPLAVSPQQQRRGIGCLLVERGLAELRSRAVPFVVVLGHPEFYGRFGFMRASNLGLTCQWNVPDEAFMAIILDRTAMDGVAGIARYRPEFDAAVS
ncbi:MAG: N-acetyltransferase [Planctomycetaceae bacterium]